MQNTPRTETWLRLSQGEGVSSQRRRCGVPADPVRSEALDTMHKLWQAGAGLMAGHIDWIKAAPTVMSGGCFNILCYPGLSMPWRLCCACHPNIMQLGCRLIAW